MAWIDTRVVTKGKEDAADRAHERGVVAAGQVGAADAAGEERVANEQIEAALAVSRHFQADAAGTMPRRVMRARLEVAKRNRFPRRIEAVDWRRRRVDRQAEQLALLHGVLIEKQIAPVKVNRHVERTLGRRDAGHVIDVGMGEENVQDLEILLRNELEQAVNLIARIDQHCLVRARTGNDEAVLVKRGNGLRLDYDHGVILAILDDLLFTSKIRSTAGHLGVTVAFARSSQAALEQMRTQPPSLVILDLNNPRTDPLGTIAAMKADASLASIPTVGYVSHVDTATIDRARSAGIGEVMARSAFVNKLEAMLANAGQP
jgi:CheY-like chemotaxis protein